MVYIWLIFGQLIPFIEVILLTVQEENGDDKGLTVNHHGTGMNYRNVTKVIADDQEEVCDGDNDQEEAWDSDDNINEGRSIFFIRRKKNLRLSDGFRTKPQE